MSKRKFYRFDQNLGGIEKVGLKKMTWQQVKGYVKKEVKKKKRTQKNAKIGEKIRVISSEMEVKNP